MKTQNITIEKNMTSYNLIVGSYVDKNYGKEKVFFTWLKNGMTGETLSWTKGDTLHVNSLGYKMANVNRADIAGILSKIKEMFPESIKEIIASEMYKSYL